MTKPTISQSQKRSQDSLGSLFLSSHAGSRQVLFLKSSTDIGVERNGGRNGARLAPRSFLSQLKKLNKNSAMETLKLTEIEVADEVRERESFDQAQAFEAEKILNNIKQSSETFVCHIGGGHDHIYPLLTAYGKLYKKIIVINLDAHADTRIDSEAHSGTPFRQFAQAYAGEFKLFQIGLLEFANSVSTLSDLSKGTMKILWREEVKDLTKRNSFFGEIQKEINESTAVIFSLDADALHASDVPGVSAVNGNGLSLHELKDLWHLYQQLKFKHKPILGIYELNPVYDTISMHSMRTTTAFLFDCLN